MFANETELTQSVLFILNFTIKRGIDRWKPIHTFESSPLVIKTAILSTFRAKSTERCVSPRTEKCLFTINKREVRELLWLQINKPIN